MGTIRVPAELRIRDPQKLAPLIGLSALEEDQPGTTRVVCGKGFRYINSDGITVKSPERDRLESLAVPPAWTDVWFCESEQGYLQATGRDDAERKQYKYHHLYRCLRDLQKFARLRYFPKALVSLRETIDKDLQDRLPGTKSYAVAAVLHLIDVGLVRVGNETSADVGHYGATTLSQDHVEVSEDEGYVMLSYIAKSGKEREVLIEDDQLVEALQSLVDKDSEHLFWYNDDSDSKQNINSMDLNSTIAKIVGPNFTAKDFRTWGGSRAALEARINGASEVESVDAAAEVLGNTRSVARSSYVYEPILETPLTELQDLWKRSRSSRWMLRADSALAKLLKNTHANIWPPKNFSDD